MPRQLPTMSTDSTPTASGSRSTQELRYTLQGKGILDSPICGNLSPTVSVLKAEPTEPLRRKGALYVEIKLSKGLTMSTATVKLPKLEWNGEFDL